MELIILLVLFIIIYRCIKSDFTKDYERVKRAHEAMELWEALEDDDYEEETKEVTKING